MSCQVCEHCQAPVSRDERIMIREGFSYHKKCHKCYVCSETNLHNAEVFKGVIFCSSCAQRIFQGCSTARRTKNTHTGRVKRTRSRSHRRRDRTRPDERRHDGSRDGVIELARLGASTTDSDDVKKQTEPEREYTKKYSKHVMSTELALQVGKKFHEERMKQMKADSTEMGTTTDVTQELLRQINCPISDCRAKEYPTHTVHTPRKHYSRKMDIINPIKKIVPVCSDLRIAELGTSTEIANMALRKKSELPVIIKSDIRLKERASYSLSVLNQESDASGDDKDWLDSNYNTTEASERTKWMDRRLGSILKLPLQLFKKNILNRSSLVSVLMSSTHEQNVNLIKRLKELFIQDVTTHQGRGVQRLYSTINRRNTPYRLGWMQMVAKVSRVLRDQNHTCVYRKTCRHFRVSHSYRCMRAQVMKLAGPTKSELACYRQKIKNILAPQFIRNIICNNKNYPAIKMSQACGSDRPRRSVK